MSLDPAPAASEASADGGGPGDDWQVRRIVVALDASPASAAAAESAARVAARLSAELLGLFVEDAILLRLASLPGCLEVGSYSSTVRPLPAGEIGRRLRGQAARARRLFEASARAAGIRHATFEVRHGAVPEALAEATGDTDLLSLGRVGTTDLARLGGVARAALRTGRGHLLLLPAGGRVEPPLAVVYGSGRSSRRTLQAALSLLAGARVPGSDLAPGDLTLLVVAGDPTEALRLETEARSLLAAAGVASEVARFRRAAPGDRHVLALTMAASRANALLLPTEGLLVRSEDLGAVVEGLDRAVLLVR